MHSSTEGSHLARFFSLEVYNRQGTTVEICTDASPLGLGGWLATKGKVTQFFACPITQEDVDRFGSPVGSTGGVQLWERLAILVVIDLWHAAWTQKRIVL